MPFQVKCVAKLRDNSGVIKSYLLQDQTGKQMEVKRLQLLEMMHNPNCDFINLKLSIDGKIIDKTEDTTPEVKCTLTAQDYAAALFRSNYDTQGKSKAEIKAVMQSVLQTEISTGQISIETLGSLSDSLERVANIHSMEILPRVHPVSGYMLKNIGNAPISYKRIDTESNQESLSVIQPNETKALTKIETVTLLMDARFSFKIHNAKMFLSGDLGFSRHEDMLNCYLYSFSNQNTVQDILYKELPESEKDRFCKPEGIRCTFGNPKKPRKKSKIPAKPNNKDARNASKPKTVFNMF